MRIGELAEILRKDDAVEQRMGVGVNENAGIHEQPVRATNGHRGGDDALARLVRAGQAIGLTVADLETLASLRADGRAPCSEALETLRGHLSVIDERIMTLRAIRREVAALVLRAEALDPAESGPASVFHLTNPAACPCTVHAPEAPSRPDAIEDADRVVTIALDGLAAISLQRKQAPSSLTTLVGDAS